jgi:hypothetical protein
VLDPHVTFRRDRTLFACDINRRAGRGLSMRAEGARRSRPRRRAAGAIVAGTPAEISRLTVPRAPVPMFRNRGSGILNVVYRRTDGHAGWIDPHSDSLARQA